MSSESQNKIRFVIKELIDFYDYKDFDENGEEIKKPVSSITGIIGEDLIAGIFQHYLEHDKRVKKIEIDNSSIKASGKKGGKMLDRWIKIKDENGNKIAYQTEIKNWSAHSLGGYKLNYNNRYIIDKEFIKAGKINFNNTWANNQNEKNLGGFKDNNVGKVLLKMKDSDSLKNENYEIIPLVCFWMPICEIELDDNEITPPAFLELKCFKDVFPIECNKKNKIIEINSIYKGCDTNKENRFGKVCIFSASIYLRKILKENPESKHIDIESQNIPERLNFIDKLMNKI